MVGARSYSDTGRIDGWKAIARYLGRDRATVMRWEAARGLPVHRLPGGGRARVFAFGRELDAWLSGASNLYSESECVTGSSTIPRRQLIVASVATATLGAFAFTNLRLADGNPEVTALLEQARILRSQNTLETQNQAIGLAAEAVRVAPRNADAWGALGYARAFASRWRSESESRRLRDMATMDGQRSLDLVPGNANGELALATALPLMGSEHWLARANGLKRALARDPTNPDTVLEQAWILRLTGHCVEAARLCQEGAAQSRSPSFYNIWARACWSAGDIDQSARALAQAASLFPTNKMLWYTRIELQMFGGRPDRAVAIAIDPEGRPGVVTDAEVTEILSIARALATQDASQVDAVLLRLRANALQSIRPAVNAIRVAAMANRLDVAFMLAEAYFFGRGFIVDGSVGGGMFIPQSQRHTNFLFEPSSTAMWSDDRFGNLLEELGLEKYWRQTRNPPDYRRH